MSIILFIIILLVLILVHEFGHFIIAKKSGIRVDEFGIGFPPKAMTIAKKGETEYTLNWIPAGGFVRIFGENPDDESINGPDKERSFVNKPAYVKAAVLAGGVFFNMLLAWILLSAIFMIGFNAGVDERDMEYASDVGLMINYVLPDSPAADVGIQPGDMVVSIASQTNAPSMLNATEAVSFISDYSSEQLTIVVDRDGEEISYTLHAETNINQEEPDRAIVGVGMVDYGFLQYKNPIRALIAGGEFTLNLTTLVVVGIVDLFAGIFTMSADFSHVAGPVGIIGEVGNAASDGITTLLLLTAFISINLAVINILPIPALDGGRLLFLAIEVVKGSPIRPQIANTLHAFFFGLLILLIVVVTYFDVAKLFG